MQRLVIVLLAAFAALSPATADDNQICFSIGTRDYDRKEYWVVGLAACERRLAIPSLSNVQKSALHKQMADWKRRMGQLDDAIGDFGAAAALNPGDHEIFDYRGDTWVAKGNDERALSDYNQAIRLKPDYPAAYLGRAEVYKRRGDVKSAEADYRRVLARPARDRIDRWAHEEARRRLSALGIKEN